VIHHLLLLLICVLAGITFPAPAQTKVGIAPPRDVDRSARKVEQSWKALLNVKPEQNLLNRPASEALGEIDKSERMVQVYLSQKKIYYSLISRSIGAYAAGLAAETDEDPGAARKSVGEALDHVVQREQSLRKQMAAIEEKAATDPRSALVRSVLRSQLQALEKIQAETRKQLTALDSASQQSHEAARQRIAAAAALGQCAEILARITETIDLEGEDWAHYHGQLRSLVKTYSVNSQLSPPPGKTALQEELDALIPPKDPK